MYSIISLPDNTHYQLIEELWAELKREFGVQGVYVTPYPHFSYQVASHYDVHHLLPLLQHFATLHAPFTVHTAGLGLFTGPSPVLYIPVVRNAALTNFQQALWEASVSAGNGIQQYYHPSQWMPHITIGFGDIHTENLPAIVRYLSTRNFSWEIAVGNIALIYDMGKRQELREKIPLIGK